jgi:hypothetical protein
MTLCMAIGVAPGKTRRSPVRSSGGVAAPISAMSVSGTATHLRAARVFPPRTETRARVVDVAPLQIVEFADAHPGVSERPHRQSPSRLARLDDRLDMLDSRRLDDRSFLTGKPDVTAARPGKPARRGGSGRRTASRSSSCGR